jgi:NADPH:quinone reductase-like Zn-dependent oxidoreductase
MKRVCFYDWGGPEQLVYEDALKPATGPGQLLVRVSACSVNPVDWKVASGAAKAVVQDSLPAVPGGDLAGTVAEVGEGVTGWSVGDEVWSLIGLMGAYAEYVAIDATSVARKPKNMSFVEAASLPLVALTAWQGFAADGRDLSDLTVLAHNAAGGVGIAAVQIAKARGARVIGTASEKNAAFVAGLGADVVVDFRTESVAEHARDVDILLDLVGNQDAMALWSLVKPGGSVVRIAGGADAPALADGQGIAIHKVRVRPNGAELGEIAALVEAGKLKTEIAKVLPLSQATEAHLLSKAGHVRGKIVLELPA